MTRLSVIIPTRNRASLLADCLASLAEQTADPELLEVLVVDDGSTDGTPDVVSVFAGRAIPFRSARQDPAGLNAGRNNGARLAAGDLLAYLDDDTVVEPGWAEAMLDAFQETACDAVAGRIELAFEAPRPAWLTDRLEMFLSGLDLGPTPREIAPPLIPFGANCAVTREALEGVAGFGAGLDREGDSLLSNGDKEFFVRLHRAGGRIVYWPAACVRHRVPESRLTRAWFRRRAWWQGVSDALVERRDGGPRGGVAREVWRAGRSLPILGANLGRGRGPFSAELWLRYCAGRAAGLRRGDGAGGPAAPQPGAGGLPR